MKIWTKLAIALGSLCLAAGGSIALAQLQSRAPTREDRHSLAKTGMTNRFPDAFDLNHDGKVARDEMNKAEAEAFAAGAKGAAGMTMEQFIAMHSAETQQRTAQLFHRLDWSGDGKLSFEEYAGPQRARFQFFDRDGKGTESCATNPVQHAAYRPGVGRRPSGFGRARFCAENDLNRDGTVTHEEFDRVTAKHFATLTAGTQTMTQAQFMTDALSHYRDVGSRIFRRFDLDHDGKLSFAEFAASDQRAFARMDRNKDGVLTQDELSSHRSGGGLERLAMHE